jgi:hypothetical protein
LLFLLISAFALISPFLFPSLIRFQEAAISHSPVMPMDFVNFWQNVEDPLIWRDHLVFLGQSIRSCQIDCRVVILGDQFLTIDGCTSFSCGD